MPEWTSPRNLARHARDHGALASERRCWTDTRGKFPLSEPEYDASSRSTLSDRVFEALGTCRGHRRARHFVDHLELRTITSEDGGRIVTHYHIDAGGHRAPAELGATRAERAIEVSRLMRGFGASGSGAGWARCSASGIWPAPSWTGRGRTRRS